jgi:peptidoglycan/xylan/chitin deacetylase (PgdA/CDA1 family)
MAITPFKIWTVASAGACAAFFLFPSFRPFVCALVTVLFAVFAWGIFSIRSNFFCTVFCGKPQETQKLCLTFDDGPDPELTDDVLDLLDRYGFTATFFVIGNNALNYPKIIKRAFNLGHTIACHDLSHGNLSNFRMSKALLRDISASKNIIKEIIGKTPLLYRPPMGLMNPHIPGVLRQLGMHCIGWSRSAKDAGNRRQKRFNFIPQLAQPGSIILVHDCLPKPELKSGFLLQLEKLFQAIKEGGLKPVGIGELSGISEYQE